MGITWDDAIDKQMLLNIIAMNSVKVDWAALSTAMGEEFTGESCRGRYKKLRKAVEGSLAQPSTEDTPKKAPAKKGVAKKLTAAEKKRKAAAEAEDDEEEDEKTERSKKGKKVKKIKTEEDEVNPEDVDDCLV